MCNVHRVKPRVIVRRICPRSSNPPRSKYRLAGIFLAYTSSSYPLSAKNAWAHLSPSVSAARLTLVPRRSKRLGFFVQPPLCRHEKQCTMPLFVHRDATANLYQQFFIRFIGYTCLSGRGADFDHAPHHKSASPRSTDAHLRLNFDTAPFAKLLKAGHIIKT